jgi:hypothetical protein
MIGGVFTVFTTLEFAVTIVGLLVAAAATFDFVTFVVDAVVTFFGCVVVVGVVSVIAGVIEGSEDEFTMTIGGVDRISIFDSSCFDDSIGDTMGSVIDSLSFSLSCVFSSRRITFSVSSHCSFSFSFFFFFLLFRFFSTFKSIDCWLS